MCIPFEAVVRSLQLGLLSLSEGTPTVAELGAPSKEDLYTRGGVWLCEPGGGGEGGRKGRRRKEGEMEGRGRREGGRREVRGGREGKEREEGGRRERDESLLGTSTQRL